MIRIVTDSAADLTAEQLSVPGIFVVPLSVTFADGTTQLDDGTMTKDEFFVRLAEDSKLPRTSQPSPASFMQVYEDAAAAGDEALVITIGQKLSGTYQCAKLAAVEGDYSPYIVDSEAASQGEALLVREAVRLRDEEGLTAEDFSVPLFGRVYAALCERWQNDLAITPAALADSLSPAEMAHLTAVLQKQEPPLSETALADYLRILREERAKARVSDASDLLAMQRDLKKKKGYGGS